MNANGTARRAERARVPLLEQKLLEYHRSDYDWSCGDLWRETRYGYYDTPPSHSSDRKGGADWPLWRDMADLDRLRQKARIVCQTNQYAKGLLGNLVNHIVGRGFSYKFQSKEGKPGSDPDKAGRAEFLDQLIAKAQDELDRCWKRNRWNGVGDPRAKAGPSREREVTRRLFRDGEVFLRYYVQDGQLVIRFIEPEQVRNGPEGAGYADGWHFGVKCDPKDAEDVQGYWVEWIDPTTVALTGNASTRGEEVDASEIEHIKGPDTDSTIRRGVSPFSWGVAAALERARVLEKNASIGAAARAAIAETWKHAHGTEAEVAAFRTGLADDTPERTKLDGSETTEKVEKRWAGMVRDVPDGMEPVYPSPDNTPAYLEGVQADLRAACAAFNAPEVWTADASNGTYAGLKEASAPVVKFAESHQVYLGGVFGRVAWKAIEVAVEAGRLPREALTLLDLQVEGPTVYQRDRLQVAQEAQIYNAIGNLSPQTIAAERGDDYEIEAANIEQHRERFGDAGSPLGMPGANGPPGMAGLGDDAGGALHEGRAAGQPPFSASLVEAGTCKPGETSKATGCTPAGDGAGAPAAEKPAAQGDAESQSYVDAFNENPASVTRSEVLTANRELKASGSPYRMVPAEDGTTFKAQHVNDVVSEYGPTWTVRQTTDGRWEALDREALPAMRGDAASKSYVDAFNDHPRSVTPEDVATANAELAADRSAYRLWPNPETERWEPARAKELDGRFGAGWEVRKNPESGRWEVGRAKTEGVTEDVGTCKPGERSDLTGCAPATKGGSGKTNGPAPRGEYDSARVAAVKNPDGKSFSIIDRGSGKVLQKNAKGAAAEKLWGEKGRSADIPYAKPADSQDIPYATATEPEKPKAPAAPKGKPDKLSGGSPATPEHLASLDAAAEKKATGIMGRVGAAIPQSWKDKASKLGSAIKGKMESRYGPTWTKAIISAGLAATPIPVPGAGPATFAAMFAAAEIHRGYKRLTGKESVGEAAEQPLTVEELERLGRAFVAELEAGLSEGSAVECDKPGCEDDCPKPVAPLLEGGTVLDVPDERQDDGWSCGAACVVSVARYFGREPNTEAEAVLALGSTPRDGTDPEKVVSVLEGAGLSTTALAGMDLESVEYYLGRGRPVVTCIQAWENSPEEAAALESGHYVVVIGADAESVVVMDPARFDPSELGGYGQSLGGQRVAVPREEFVRRWRDQDAEGNTYERYGVAVRGPDPGPTGVAQEGAG